MTMSTPILRDAARLLSTVLVDLVEIFNVGDPVTVGTHVTRSLTPVSEPATYIPGLVQTVTLENAVESRTNQAYSVKVPAGTDLRAGQAVKVQLCYAEPDLVGKVLLIDKISKNGLAMIRKATAADFEVVNQEGKEGLS